MKFFLIVIIALIALIAIWIVTTYNGLIKSRNNVEEGYSTMDVYMKKRYDLIPNLVETVKGYAKHEQETLTQVVQARNNAVDASSVSEKIQAENALSGTLKSLFAIAESYPDLKANANFMDLQRQLQGVEQDIANSRKYYNGVVKQYNNKCQMFPSNIISSMFRFETRAMFEVDNNEERENVKVSFGA